MAKPSAQRWLSSLVGGSPGTYRRTAPRTRLDLLRLECRDVPSSSIPLNGFTWTSMGPSPITLGQVPGQGFTTGPVANVAASGTNPNVVYAASSFGGVWRSTDGGANWSPRTDHAQTLNTGAIHVVARTAADTVYVATDQGVMVSDDGGNNFVMIPGSPAASLAIGQTSTTRMVVIPDPAFPQDRTRDRIWLAADAPFPNVGAVWRSLNGGGTWTPIFQSGSLVTDVIVDSTNLNVVYACVGDPAGALANGAYKTLNGLSATPTWNLLIGGNAFLPGFTPGVVRLAVAPNLPSTLFLSVAERQDAVSGVSNLLGVFRSQDGGRNWLRLGVPPLGALPDFMGASGYANNVVAIDPTSGGDPNAQIVYLAGRGDGTANVLLSTNSGVTWTDISVGANGVGPYVGIHGAGFDANNRFIVASQGGVTRLNSRTPGNINWQQLNGSPGPTALNTTTTISTDGPTLDPNRYVTNLGDDHSAAIFLDSLGKGAPAYGWQTIDAPSTAPFHTPPGDAGSEAGVGQVFWNPDNPFIAYRVITGSDGSVDYIRRSTDGGLTWEGIADGITWYVDNVPAVPIAQLDPGNPNRLYVALDSVQVSNDGGNTFGKGLQVSPNVNNQIPDLPSTGKSIQEGGPYQITAFASSRQVGGQLLLAATAPFTVDQTLPNGTVIPVTKPRLWANIIPSVPLPVEFYPWFDIGDKVHGGFPLDFDPIFGLAEIVTKIIIDPANTLNLYVTTRDQVDGRDHVYFGTSQADLFDTWTEITGNAPTLINTIVLDPKVATNPLDDVLYIGTSPDGVNPGGVYALTNPAGFNNVWKPVGLDPNNSSAPTIPNVSVLDLKINTTSGILTASTFGRGVWQLQIRGLIQGQKFEDIDGDGIFDLGEPPIPNWTIRLLDVNGVELATTVTDANGFYEFRSISSGDLPGTYQVVEAQQPGWFQSTANPPLLTGFTEQSTAVGSFTGVGTPPPSYQIIDNLNFGNFRLATISGVKFEDRNGNGVRDTGEPAPTERFQIFIDEDNDNTLDWTDLNSNTVWDQGEGERWTLTAAGTGAYTLDQLIPGTYNIREVQQAGFIQTSVNPAPITPLSGETVGGQDFGNIRIGRIQGAVFNDLNGNGVHDVGDPGAGNFTLQLIDLSNGLVFRTVVTAPDGSYEFLSLPAGNYQLREVVPAGWIQTFPVPPAPVFYTINLAATDQISGFEFGNFRLFSVGGIKFEDLDGDGVRDPGENGIPNFTIQVRNLTTGAVGTSVTDAFGNYNVPNLGPGTYEVREVQKPGWLQTTANPANFQGTSGLNRTNTNFGNFRLVTATGTVYNDVDGDGVRDPGELGLPGFTVTMDTNGDGLPDRSAVSDGNGNYSFGNVGPGSYVVRQTPRRGWRITAPANGQYNFTAISSQNPTGLNFGNRNDGVYAVGRDAGSVPMVSVRFVTSNQEKFNFMAYAGSFRGGVRVATGYTDGTVNTKLITAPGPGGGPHVRVWNTDTGDEEWSFFAYDPRFTGGVYVAAGDVDGDGYDDIVTGADAGGGPHVRALSGRTHEELYSFFAFIPTFTGGVRVAVADVNADGKGDIIAGAGPGGGPHVKVFSGADGSELHSFFAFDGSFRGGVYVSGGDFNGDGKADIVAGAGAGGGPHVRILNGINLAELGNVFPFAPSFRGGVRVSALDVNFDNKLDLVVGSGPGQQPIVKTYSMNNAGVFSPIASYNAFDPSFLGGVWVG